MPVCLFVCQKVRKLDQVYPETLRTPQNVPG